MSLSLCGLYLFFLIGGHVTAIPILCGLSAALLHYFMLVFFTWTAVEAIWLYIKLVLIFGTQSHENKFIIKSGLPAWSKLRYYHCVIPRPDIKGTALTLRQLSLARVCFNATPSTYFPLVCSGSIFDRATLCWFWIRALCQHILVSNK